VETYPFGSIESFKEDNVKFQMLFEKCTTVYNVNFYRNQSTCIIRSLKFPLLFCSSNPFLVFFISLIYMVLQFLDFPNFSIFVLLGNWCVISCGRRNAVAKFMVLWWIGIAWNVIYLRNGILNTPGSPTPKVSPLHVVFYLNKVLVTTCFDRGRYWRVPLASSFSSSN
jgi:hypothetical protein